MPIPSTLQKKRLVMKNLTQNQMAEAVASGKRRYELDKIIGWQIILGVLFVACGASSTVPIGLGLLILTFWLRKTT